MAAFAWAPGERGTVRAGGKALEAACLGPPPGEAPTVVMLHEGLGCVELWRGFPQALADATGWGVFAYSRAGYGRSEPADLPFPTDYMTREAMGALPEVLEAIGFERGILLGHSDGATIAAIYAGSVADHRVRGLVLMAPHFFTEPGGLAAIAKAREAFAAGDLKARMAKYHDDPERAFRGWNDVWLSEEFRDWNVAEAIDYLRVPVLAIQGRDDAYGTLAQIDEIDRRIYAPLETEIIEGCGHSPHTEAPGRTLAAVAEFLERLSRIEAVRVQVA